MTDKELKKLSRAELLEMLIAQIEENESDPCYGAGRFHSGGRSEIK